MTLHISQTNTRFAQLATTGLVVIQAAIATATIGTFATQPVSAQAMKLDAQSARLFETKQKNTAANALGLPQAACWANSASQNCSYTINTAHPISLELPQLQQQNAVDTVVPSSATTCWAGANAQNCSYTISLSQADRLTPYPLPLLSELPTFDTPIKQMILVRVSF